MPSDAHRIPILYLAPWVDIGGSDKGTIDWFRFLDRDRFRASLITTQPSSNRRLAEIIPYADEVWDLPDLMNGDEFARFILTFIHTRGIKVVHVMNSRLGFELLPEIAGLPDPPRVVVQLHVEEPNRSGYVRYVAARYGTLVDAFSISSLALAEVLGGYDIPRAKLRVISTGVDAEREFCPDRVQPIQGLDPDRLQILFPARLTAQKDPLLMVDVAAGLRAAGLRFQLHALGHGELTDVVRSRVAAAGLGGSVSLGGECLDIAPWYAASDLVLLTSEYEGLPYVAYEAMAMATPIVAPDLPGLRELVTPGTGMLVSSRGQPEPYVTAIRELATDHESRKRLGDAARTRVLTKFPLERMAAEHGELYDELLAIKHRGRKRNGAAEVRPNGLAEVPPGALRGRRPGATPLVSVIVPCFNHGLYLESCLESIASQSYAPIETIVVDDGSTDPETLSALARLENTDIVLLRMAENRGPSAARNAAIERVRGRYVLPVDADNILLPGAISALVEQLSSAGEQIGFVYPNFQFFGNRTDYFEPPSYNLYALLASNYCDTCSLIDREVFDRRFRYAEDIALGHEDWDLMLSLAESGIYGEPARTKTLLFRKQGFTRSDLVDSADVPFGQIVAARHPALFDQAARGRIKAEWSPALTVIALDPLPEDSEESLPELVAAAARQTCGDFELIVRTASEFWPTELGRRLRRVPSAIASSRAQALAQNLEIARGRYALATYGSPAALLAETSVIEKILHVLRVNPGLDGLALAEGERGLPTLRLLSGSAAARAPLGALCWTTTGEAAPSPSLALDGPLPLQTLARWLSAHGTLQWRHVARRDRQSLAAAADGGDTALGAPLHGRARDARRRARAPAELPELPSGIGTRLRSPNIWKPPHSRLLCRHLHRASGRYIFTNDDASPPGCASRYALGSVRALPLPGTTSLVTRVDAEATELVLGESTDIDAPELLGFVEQAPLPLFDRLLIGRHRETGQPVLIAGAEDPLVGLVEHVTPVGYIEPYPIHPRHPPHAEVGYGLIGLVRTVDLSARRHRYAAGEVPAGQLAGELGALLAEPLGECEPLWIGPDGWVFTAHAHRANDRPSIRSALLWTRAPLVWEGADPMAARLRASARRAYDATRLVAGSQAPSAPSAPRPPAGYLARSAGRTTVPLYASTHPVTADQLLSADPREGRRLGYGPPVLLGHLFASAPVTGTLGAISRGVPWAARFGRTV